jgi:hypothetical protein
MKMELPPPLAAFFQAFNAHAVDAVGALFAEDASVADEGQEYRGLAAIKEWVRKVDAKYRPHADPTDFAYLNDTIVVTAQVSGTFPGSPVELHYRFTLKDGKVAALTCD